MIDAQIDRELLEPRRDLISGDQAAIELFQRRIRAGEPWYPSLLAAISLWRSPEEVYGGRYYRYLFGGEAFDYVTLAERLIETVPGPLPEDEVEALLFHAQPPMEIEEAEFRRLIGPTKYRFHLNYVYGVIVEEALQLAVLRAYQKELLSRPWPQDERAIETPHERIYGQTEQKLLQQFQIDRGLPRHADLPLAEYRELTYWLFKYRLKACDRARIASDTRKAITELQTQRRAVGATETIPEWTPPSDDEVIDI